MTFDEFDKMIPAVFDIIPLQLQPKQWVSLDYIPTTSHCNTTNDKVIVSHMIPTQIYREVNYDGNTSAKYDQRIA